MTRKEEIFWCVGLTSVAVMAIGVMFLGWGNPEPLVHFGGRGLMSLVSFLLALGGVMFFEHPSNRAFGGGVLALGVVIPEGYEQHGGFGMSPLKLLLLFVAGVAVGWLLLSIYRAMWESLLYGSHRNR